MQLTKSALPQTLPSTRRNRRFTQFSFALCLLLALSFYYFAQRVEYGSIAHTPPKIRNIGDRSIPENPDVELLDIYLKTNSEAEMQEIRRKEPNVTPTRAIFYVQWRLKSSGKVYEDTVAMDKLLPEKMNDKRLGILIEESQLFIYLVSNPGQKDTGCPIIMYKDSDCKLIYPAHWWNFMSR